jgi:hypothetical protein
MEEQNTNIIAGAAYAALRHGGAPPERARAQLSLGRRQAVELEALFRKRRDFPMRPRFCRHDAHVKAVLAQGAFAVLPERPR